MNCTWRGISAWIGDFNLLWEVSETPILQKDLLFGRYTCSAAPECYKREDNHDASQQHFVVLLCSFLFLISDLFCIHWFYTSSKFIELGCFPLVVAGHTQDR